MISHLLLLVQEQKQQHERLKGGEGHSKTASRRITALIVVVRVFAAYKMWKRERADRRGGKSKKIGQKCEKCSKQK